MLVSVLASQPAESGIVIIKEKLRALQPIHTDPIALIKLNILNPVGG